MRFVLFTLFDGALMLVHVVDGGEALHGLNGEIAVRHGVADYDDFFVTFAAQFGGDEAAERALAASGAHGADRDHGDRGLQLRALGAEQPEIGTGGDDAGAEVHQVLVRDVAVGEDGGVDVVLVYEAFEVVFFEDRNALQDTAIRLSWKRPDIFGQQCREFVWL